MVALPTIADVLAARERIAGAVARTPTRRAPKLAELVSAREVWVKFDNQQHTGAFKERGALNALLTLDAQRAKKGVVTASAGNHAQALAHHATRLGISTVVVMPVGTPQVKVDGAKKFGAKVVLRGEYFEDAMAAARAIEAEEGRALVHPFDDAAVIAGQATATLELLEDAPGVEIVPVQVGGGGLISGAHLAAEAQGGAARIIGVEPAMYPCMKNALDGANRPVGGDTIAEGIAVKGAGEITQALCRERMSGDDILLVDEDAIEEAVVTLAMKEKTVAEGAGAAGLAALTAYPDLFADRVVGILVCGGNIDARLLGQVLARHLVRTRRRARIRVECRDQPGHLAGITAVLRESGANVIDVLHDRLALEVPAKDTIIDLIIETDDEAATLQVVENLHAAGFPRARIIEGWR